VVKHKEGEYYNEFKSEADLGAIRDYYGWTGSAPLIKKELAYPEPGVCQVVYQVQERPPNRVGQVFVVGNEWTRQNVILRQVPLFPGQVLTYPDIRRRRRTRPAQHLRRQPRNGSRAKVEVLDRTPTANSRTSW
jgi:outer membrane protein assembly factor BamA